MAQKFRATENKEFLRLLVGLSKHILCVFYSKLVALQCSLSNQPNAEVLMTQLTMCFIFYFIYVPG